MTALKEIAMEILQFVAGHPQLAFAAILLFLPVGLFCGAVALHAVLTGRAVTLGPLKIGPSSPRRQRSTALPPFETERHSPPEIEGRRLFEYEGYYPIDIAPSTNKPTLNRDIFRRAMKLLTADTSDRIAAMDLVYLREHNLRFYGDVLAPEDQEAYDKLVQKYHLESFREHVDQDDERLFGNYKRLVGDIGKTLNGTHVEIVLHNVRNPLRSIIAAYGTAGISDRQINDPSTRFVVQYLKNQGRSLYEALESGGEIAYLKQFTREKQVKATTIPIYDHVLGLVGLICINIDIDTIISFSAAERKMFIEAFTRNSGRTPSFELEAWGLATNDAAKPAASDAVAPPPCLGPVVRGTSNI
jgi:predicted transcriptional regulator YheO